MINILFIDDEEEKMAGFVRPIRTAIEEALQVDLKITLLNASITPDDFRSMLVAKTDYPIRLLVANANLYWKFGMEMLVKPMDLVAYDINLKNITHTIPDSSPALVCSNNDFCDCGLTIAIKMATLFGLDHVAIVSSNAEQVKKIEARHGNLLFRLYQGYLKDGGLAEEVKKFTARVLALVENEKRVTAGLKQNDFAFELARTWSFGGPGSSTHGFNRGDAVEPDVLQATEPPKQDVEFRSWVVENCITRFSNLEQWLRARRLEESFSKEAQDFRLFGQKLHDLQRQNAPPNPHDFKRWFNEGMKIDRHTELWTPPEKATATLKDVLYRTHLTFKGNGISPVGNSLALDLKNAINNNSTDKVTLGQCARSAEVFIPQLTFRKMFEPLTQDLSTGRAKKVKISSEMVSKRHGPLDYRKVLFALEWEYSSCGWGGCEHPFKTASLSPFFDQAWLTSIYDLWLIYKDVNGSVMRLDAVKLFALEKKGAPAADAWRESVVISRDAPPLSFFGTELDPSSLELVAEQSGFNNCLLFAISSCDKVS